MKLFVSRENAVIDLLYAFRLDGVLCSRLTQSLVARSLREPRNSRDADLPARARTSRSTTKPYRPPAGAFAPSVVIVCTARFLMSIQRWSEGTVSRSTC